MSPQRHPIYDVCPFEVWLFAVTAATGLVVLVGLAPSPPTLARLLPHALVLAWNIVLVIGGALALSGVTTRRPALTRMGLSGLGPAAIVYGGAVFVATGAGAAINAGIVAGYGIACLWRAHQINVRLRDAVPP